MSGEKTFSLAPRQDTLDEDDEKLTVHATATDLTIADAEVTITDDDALPELTIADASVAEGGKAEFTVTLDVVSGRDVTVQWTTGDDGAEGAKQATADTDYTARTTAQTLTIAAGSRTGTIEVQTTEDTIAEGAETFTVTLASPTNATLGSSSTATGTITDDDTAPTTAALSVSPSSVAEGAAATTVTVTATLAGSVTFTADTTVAVTVGKDGDAAESGTDYTGVSGFSITITAGELSGEKTFSLAPRQDTLDEDDEKLTVHATATDLTIADAEVTITDDDALPELTIADASAVTEGDDASMATSMTFTVTLSAASGRDVSVDYTLGGTATAGEDYTDPETKTITIAAGSATGSIIIPVLGDELDEPNETVTVTLTSPANATLGTTKTASGTITDDDERGVTLTNPTGVAVPAGGLTVHEVDKAETNDVEEHVTTYEVSLASKPTGTVTITVASVDATVATVSPRTLTFTPSDWDAETVTVTAVDDDLDNAGDQRKTSITHTVSSSGNDYDGESVGSVAVTVTDDEATPVATLSLSSATINESGNGNASTVKATLSGKSDRAVTIEVSVPNGSPVTLSANKTLTIAAGTTTSTGTVTLTAVDNDVDAPNATVTVSGAASGGGVANPSPVTLTITDDEGTPTVSLVLTPATINESGNGNASTVKATLSGKSDRAVTIEVSVPAQSPVTLSANKTLTIALGATTSTGTVTLTAVDNDVDAPNATVTVSGAASGGGVANPQAVTLTITDDDTAPTTAALSVSPSSVAEGAAATTVTVTATLAGSVTFTADTTVAVTVGKDGDTAVSDTDYTGVSGFSITITAGELSGEKTFSLAPRQDTLDEDDEKLTVHATATDLTIADAEVTITDDDALPELTIADASVAEGGKAEFTVTLDVVSGRDVTVQWTTGDDGAEGAKQATADTDYTARTTAQTLTIAAGSRTGTIEVQTTEDTIAEGAETFTVTLASPTNATLGSSSTATGTITDDDTAPTTAALSVSPSSVAEGAAATTVTVTATLAGSVTFTADTTVAVTVGKDGDTAVSDTDYTGVSGFSITITAGELSGEKTFSLAPRQDTLDEDDEKLTVHATATDLTIADAEVTITDDDALPELTIADASVAEGGKAEFTVTLDVVSGRDVTVQWTTGDDGAEGAKQATADTDYTARTTAQTLTIAAGSRTGTIEVQTTEDTIAEGAETFTVTLASPTNATLGSSSTATGTITDDDTAPTTAALSVSPSSVAEGAAATTVTVTATLAGSVTFTADTTVAVTVGKDGDTAVSDTDYTGVSGFSITITAGELSGEKTFSLAPRQDTLDEDDEKLTVHATATDLTIADAEVTITDDDALPELTIADASVAEGGKAEFTVTLDVVSGRDVTVQWTTGDDGAEGAKQATADTDYTARTTAQTLTIAAGSRTGTIEVQTTEDTIAEGAETFTVTLASPTNATLGSSSTATGTITDDDTAPTTAALSVSPSSVAEGAAATTVTVTATLAGSVTFTADTTVAVTVGKDGDTAVSDTDYTGVSGFSITITAGELSGEKTFSLAPRQDTLDEDDEKLTVHATATDLTIADAEVTITDDDALPELTIADASVAEGGKAEFTVTLDVVSGRDVTVQWTTGDDGAEGAKQATADTDYTARTTAQTLTIAAGSRTGTIEVQTTEDTIAEGAETFTVTLASPTNATLGSSSTATGTITDDDTAPTTAALSVSPSSVAEGAAATTVTVTATLAGSVTFTADTTVAVTVGKDGDAAESGTDYTGVSGFSITITAGELSGEKTFSLAPRQDTLDEDDEKLTVHATATDLTIADAEVTITDDDALPELTIADASAVTEGDDASMATSMTFTVTLSAASGRDVSVDYTLGGTATAGEDYTDPETKTITIAAGSATGSIIIPVLGDELDEPNETVTVTLTSPANATLGTTKTASGTITDDDERGVTLTNPTGVAVPAGGLTVHEVDKAETNDVEEHVTTYEVSLASKPTGTVTITVASVDATVATVSPRTLTFTPSDWDAETVTVTAVDDDLDNAGDQRKTSITHTVSSSGNDYDGESVGSVAVTVTDDEATPVATLSLSSATINESGNGNASTVKATLSGKSDRAVTIEVSVPNGSPVTLSANKTLTIAAGTTTSTGTVTLTAVDNDVDAPNATVTVSGAASGGGVANPSPVTLTITDDEGTPTVSLVLTPATINESGNGNASTVKATLSGKSDRAVTIEVSVPAQSPVTLSANKTLTIALGATTSTGTVTLTAVDNDVDAPNATVTVSGAASGGGVANPQAVTLTITDDDTAPTTAALSVSPSSVAEGAAATTVTVTATLAGSVTFTADTTVAVTVGKDGDTAVSDTDYTGVSGFSITITAGELSGEKTFSLAPRQDTLDEDDEKLTVHATATDLTIADAEVTITDDDALPELTIADASVAEGGKAEFTVTLDVVSGRDVTVQWTTGDDGAEGAKQATADTDYTARTTAQTLTIAAGSRTGTIEVQTTEDTIAEGAETFTVTLASPTNATLGSSSTATGTITDDDTAPTTAALSVSPSSVAEGAAATTVTVTATLAGSVTFTADTTVAVTVGKDGDTAVSDTDYTGVSGFSITITAGELSGEKTFSLAPRQDTLDEDDEKLTVHATATDLTIADAEVTITDDDALPELTIADASVAEGGKAEFTVTLDVVSGRDVTVQWTTGDDGAEGAKQATADTDYTARTTAQTLTIAAGSRTGTIEVQTTEDTIAEGAETFTVTLASPTNATLGSSSTATGTITDDDTAPTTAALSVSPSSVAEGAAATTVTVTATLAGSVTFTADTTVAVTVGKDGDTAVSDTDYTGVSGFSITITAGELSGEKTFSLAPRQDTLDEDDEKLTVHATATDLTIADAEVTITDDDALPELTIADASVAEGGKAEFTVTLDVVSGRDVTVQWTTGDDGAEGAKQATADTDYTARTTAQTLTIAAGSRTGTIEVQTTEDTIAEGAETFTVTLASPTNATLGSSSTATGTITDDDTAPTTAALSVSPSSVAEGAAATTVTVTATLAGSVTFTADTTVAVTVGKDGDAAESGTDYTGVSGFSITITAGELSGEKTFSLAPRQDTLDEDDEKLTVHATATDLTIADAEVTITDDDALPELTIADASAVTEGDDASMATSMTFTVTLSAASGRDVSVDYTLGGTATAGEDYTDPETKTITIAAGSATGSIIIPVLGDELDEPNETVTVTLTSPANATLGTTKTASGTITDDDERGVTLTNPTGVAVPAGGLTVHEVDKAETNDVEEHVTTYEVSLASKPTGTVTITVASVDATVATVSPRTLTFTPSDWDAETVTVTAVDDDLDNAGDQRKTSITHTVSSSGNDYDGESVGSVAVTVTDDEATPVATLSLSSATINESGNGNASTVKATLSGKSDRAVTIEVSVPNGSPVTLSANKTLTIAAGTTTSTGTVTLTAVDNDVDAPNATVTVSGAASGGGVANPSPVTLTITDDEGTPTVSLVLTPATINESGNGNASTVKATLSGKSDRAVTIEVSVPAQSPVTLSANKTLTIALGATTSTGTVTLTAVDNDVDAPNATVTVSGAASGGGVANPQAVTLTITDDDTAPTTAALSVSPSSVAEGAAATTVTVTATLAGSVTFTADTTVAVTVGKDGDTAVSDTDYTGVSGFSITITAGELSGEKTFSLAPRQDTLDEDDEKLTVHATATGLTISDASMSITDDDTASTTASLSVSPSSVAEGAAATTVTVTATLAGSVTFNADTTVAVKVGKDDDTASSGTDYTGVSGFSITITAGQSSGQGTFSLAPRQDTLDEDDEKLTVHATATGLTISDAEVTISDDDDAPTASVADAIAVMEGDSPQEIADMTFVVSLSNVSGKSVTVSYTLGGTATAGSDYTAPDPLSVTIPAGSQQENIVISILGDTVVEGDETITVTLSSSSPRVRSRLPRQSPPPAQQASGTIQDNDGQPGVPSSLVLSPATISEGGGDRGATFVTARLSEPVTADVTFTVAVAPSTNATASDFRISTNRVLTVKAGALESRGFVTITAVDDDEVGPGKTVEVSATVTGTTQVQDPDPEDLTIGDDDLTGPPDSTVTFERAAYSLNEDGQLDIEVHLSSALATTAEVRYLLHAPNSVVGMDGDIITRSDGPDGWVSTGELTFAAGDTRRLIRILPVDNNIVEPDEEVAISLLVVSGRVRAGSPTVVTLTDDDRSVLYLRPTYAEVEEGEQSRFRLRMQKPHQDDVTVDLAVSGTARAGEDFATLPPILTIPAGGQTADVLIPTVADGLPEGTETLLVALTSVVGQHVTIDRSAGQHTLLIRDTTEVSLPTAVTLSVSPASVAENAGATTLTLTAAFVGAGTLATDTSVTVTVGQSGDTAVSGADYTAADPVTVPITAGQGSGQATFTLTPTNDALPESPETLTLHGAATGLAVSDATVTITDDDSTPTAVALSVSPGGVSESAGATTLTLTAAFVGGGTLTTDASVTVTVGQPGDTAVSGADYTAAGRVTVPITAGQSSGQATFTLEPTDDTLAEGPETLTLNGATTGLTVSNATVTIIDDDPAPTAVALSVSPASVAENAGATTLTLMAALIGTGTFTTDTSVTVTVGASGDTAVAGTDYTAAGTVTVPIAAGQGSGQATFTLEPTDDALEERAETLTLHGAAAGLAVSDATVTIADDDSGQTRVRRRLTVARFGSASYTLNEDGSPVEIAVRLSSAPSEAVEFTFTMVSATAEIGRTGDVWALAGEPGEWRYDQQLIFAPGQTQQYIKLFPVDNNLVEPDEVVTISLSVVSGNATPGPSTTLTLTDDDLATVLLMPPRSQANEGESAQIRLRLTKPHQQDVTLDGFVRGTATSGVDYAPLPQAVMIPAGSQTAVIPVEVLSDEIAEGAETLVFVIANPSRSGVVISPEYSEHTVTIMDVTESNQAGNGQ